MRVASILIITIALLGAAPSWADEANDKLIAAYRQSIDDARHGRYLDASYGVLDRLGITRPEQIGDADVFEQWSQVMSTMTGQPTFNADKTKPDFTVPAGQVEALHGAKAVPALEEIVKRARKTRIVILDENHLDPKGRAFALQVARALRPLGYSVLAMEALKGDEDDKAAEERMAKLAADGYPRQSTGYYFDDPVFSDFLRHSLAMGYKPVAYETSRKSFSQAEREQDQAGNLVRRAVKAFPKAKILIYAGEHHAAKKPITVEKGNAPMMAELLKRATGIDPLTIDQAGLSAIPMNRPDADLYGAIADKAVSGAIVPMAHGKPLVTGLMTGAVDLEVVHPRAELVDGRPSWLAGMGRKPVSIPADLLPTAGTRLIQAFVASEAEDAIPVDQVLVTGGEPVPPLMLPPVAVRYAFQDLVRRP